jgi:hypothetical protein
MKQHLHEPILTCPHCKGEIKLTESLAGPMVESTRQLYEQKMVQKDAEVQKMKDDMRSQQEALSKAKDELAQTVNEKVKVERQRIATEEMNRARDAMAEEIAKKDQENIALMERLNNQSSKLKEANNKELELLKEREKLQEEKERFELDKQRAIDAARKKIQEDAQSAADERASLKLKAVDEEMQHKLAEKEKIISDMQKQLKEMDRKVSQGSQQLQGEVQELAIEDALKNEFSRDTIEPVPKGERGADALHYVYNQNGQSCGSILWESKRTKNWNNVWLTKAREDQRDAQADVVVIVSKALPDNIETFSCLDGVWVIAPRYLIPVGTMLRHFLLDLAGTRRSGEGQLTKSQMVYEYLTGVKFRQRVEAAVEKFTDMQDDLEKEKKTITKLWAKRESQIRCVIDSVAGMYGDIQGIAGQAVPEIQGLDSLLLGHDTEGSLAGSADVPF